jgi:hypothetical protein
VNPILVMTSDAADPLPMVELKQHLVLYVADPPGPQSARRVYDIYLQHFGDVFKSYRSTFSGAFLEDWNAHERSHFEQTLLPALRTKVDWGYGFSDGKATDSWLLMFHGFRPFQEPRHAGFYRFEFDWQMSPQRLRALAEHLINEVPFLSGYGGYLLQGRPDSEHTTDSYDKIFALAKRYWCCDVEDVELTAEQMKTGYKCVNWLTLIGEPWRSNFDVEIGQAKSVAFDHAGGPSGVLLQIEETPILGDRNRQADLSAYAATAHALLPMQIQTHMPFWGECWTEENTMAWLRRFTHPQDV